MTNSFGTEQLHHWNQNLVTVLSRFRFSRLVPACPTLWAVEPGGKSLVLRHINSRGVVQNGHKNDWKLEESGSPTAKAREQNHNNTDSKKAWGHRRLDTLCHSNHAHMQVTIQSTQHKQHVQVTQGPGLKSQLSVWTLICLKSVAEYVFILCVCVCLCVYGAGPGPEKQLTCTATSQLLEAQQALSSALTVTPLNTHNTDTNLYNPLEKQLSHTVYRQMKVTSSGSTVWGGLRCGVWALSEGYLI